jgi:hypothetical protein
MSISDAILNIASVFPELPLPDMTLQEAELADHTLDRDISEEEWEAARQAGKGITWTQVPLETLLSCSAALSHLSEVGFVYFIPAYMVAALQHRATPKERTADLLTSTVFHVTHTDTNYSLSRLKAFNAAQAGAVIEFLREVGKTADFDGRNARECLERYWLTPKSKEPLIYVP